MTQDDGRIVVCCDAPHCTAAGRYTSYMEASMEGWHLQCTREDSDRKDYCDRCFRKMVDPDASVSLSREDALYILGFLEGIHERGEILNDAQARDSLADYILTMKAALGI